jgi:plastocyanin
MKVQSRRSPGWLRLLLATGIVVFAACNTAPSEPAPAAPTAVPAAAAVGELQPVATVQDIMLSIVDPNADVIWNSVATIVTLEGTEDRRPRTDEEWLTVRHSAISLVEATNLLLMGGRLVAKHGVKSENPGIELEPEEIEALLAKDPVTWKSHVRDLHAASLDMLEAIDAKDADKLFDLGGPLDAVCESCHQHYWYPSALGPPASDAEKAGGTVGPNADAGDATDGSTALAAGPAGGAGTIQGHVRLAGKAPGNAVIRMGMDPKCADANRGKQTVDEIVAVTRDGSLANVLVQLEGPFPETPVPAEPVVIDQRDCLFAPRVVAARVGQVIQFKNSDPLLHNVHGMSAAANSFNLAQPMKDMVSEVKLQEEPGGLLHVKCDVHRWMSEYIGVVEHPYFAVSDRGGAFTIRGVPAGEHTLVAWHEKYGALKQSVAVAAGGTAPVELTYPGEAL